MRHSKRQLRPSLHIGGVENSILVRPIDIWNFSLVPGFSARTNAPIPPRHAANCKGNRMKLRVTWAGVVTLVLTGLSPFVAAGATDGVILISTRKAQDLTYG